MVKNILIFFISIFFFLNVYATEIKILVKVENKVITNIDINNEKKYLILLNPKLKQLQEEQKNILAKKSIVREKIKLNLLEKKINLNKPLLNLNKIEKKIYNRLNLESINQFKKFLINNNLNYEEIRLKLKIETLWNQFIYQKFRQQLNINEEELKNKLIFQQKNEKKEFEYHLYEIFFQINKKDELSKKLKDIKKSISDIGFESTANIYGISDSAKFGGEIGWIKETQLSSNIKKEINKINIGELSEPIRAANGYLVFIYKEKKEINKNFDLENELKSLIDYEINRQLNQLSLIYYNKIKQNSKIYEFK